jgi:hypothetical protein
MWRTSKGSARKFPGPWRVDVTEGGHFVVKDATGFSICCVYSQQMEALRVISQPRSVVFIFPPWPGSIWSSPARGSAYVTYRTIIARGYFEMGSGFAFVMM